MIEHISLNDLLLCYRGRDEWTKCEFQFYLFLLAVAKYKGFIKYYVFLGIHGNRGTSTRPNFEEDENITAVLYHISCFPQKKLDMPGEN